MFTRSLRIRLSRVVAAPLAMALIGLAGAAHAEAPKAEKKSEEHKHAAKSAGEDKKPATAPAEKKHAHKADKKAQEHAETPAK